MKSIKLVFLLVAAIYLSGCAQNIGVKKVGIRERYRQLTEDIFEKKYPSEKTIICLAENDLLNEWKKSPLPVLKKLDSLYNKYHDREVLSALTELCFYEAERRDEGSRKAMPYYLSSTVYAYKYLFGRDSENLSPFHPTSRLACEIYNRSLAELLMYIEKHKIMIKENTIFNLINGKIKIEQKRSQINYTYDDFDEIKVVYRYKVEGLDYQFRTFGIGVPLIATRKAPAVKGIKTRNKYTPRIKQTHAATFFLRIKSANYTGSNSNILYKADVEIYDPNLTEKIKVNGKNVPLETDFTTPLAYLVNKSRSPGGFMAMLNAAVWEDTQGLFLLEPYHRGKIPVVFVHGLMSEPKTWLKMLNNLKGDPQIRKFYQFWFFKYPTGNPVLFSAANLRQSLLNARKTFDPDNTDKSFDKMVLIGHSMGGIISRLMVQNSSNLLWKAVSDKPIDDYNVTLETKDFLKKMFLFTPVPFISEVIFICAPHRGSAMAKSWYARLGSMLVWPAKELINAAALFVVSRKSDEEKLKLKLKRIPTGLDSLLPDNPMHKIMMNQPIASNVVYYSIIGNEDKADTPGGTDGIVPYSSSHLAGAREEIIIHSGHSAQTKPRTIMEIKKILIQHLKNNEK